MKIRNKMQKIKEFNLEINNQYNDLFEYFDILTLFSKLNKQKKKY
jgi:hypothetical protein